MRTSGFASAALLAALLVAAPVAADDAEWIESYDKASSKKFYYNSVSRESSWEAPAGAKVKYLSADESSSQSSSTKADGGNGLTTLSIIVAPMVLLMGGLVVLYQRATGEGLLEALAAKGKERNRAAKRRGQSAGSNFRHRQKLSQDGKGGRSANS